MREHIAIIGGGASGFFLSIELKRILPDVKVTIFEKSKKCLSKVEISGGGRCNCTNTFKGVDTLKSIYPRGEKVMKKIFKEFNHEDTCEWFENHGVKLIAQDDNCIFPKTQDSKTIINCFLREAMSLGVEIKNGYTLDGINIDADGMFMLSFKEHEEQYSSDFLSLTIGGQPKYNWILQTLEKFGHSISMPCPSLFSFMIDTVGLTSMPGLVIKKAILTLPSTKFKCCDTLLITHKGISGPAVLKLSSLSARFLSEKEYHYPILINWTGINNIEHIETQIDTIIKENGNKQIGNVRCFNLQNRLWIYLLEKAGIDNKKRWSEIGNKGRNRLVNILTNDEYKISGRNMHKDEFVTCGGVGLDSINHNSMESKFIPNLFFAGELLDIDAITGGFNLQAAWTTGYVAAHGIIRKINQQTL